MSPGKNISDQMKIVTWKKKEIELEKNLGTKGSDREKRGASCSLGHLKMRLRRIFRNTGRSPTRTGTEKTPGTQPDPGGRSQYGRGLSVDPPRVNNERNW